MKFPHITPRSYEATISLGDTVLKKSVLAVSRRRAVRDIELWFWYEFHGSQGPVHKALRVADPYHEVVYGPKFRCNDLMNKFLPEDVILRLLLESKGELIRDEREGRPSFPPGSVRRKKRRRDFGIFIAPGIRKMKNGLLYYRVTTSPQVTCDGITVNKRKYKDIRLKAKTIVAAIDEIKIRGLHLMHDSLCRRKMKVRDLSFTGHVAGILSCSVLTDKQKHRFRRVIMRYKEKIPA